jgi:putative aminopeptidase FrvX
MVLLLVVAILLIESELRGSALVGANDNASGVAALLAVATALKHAHAYNVETWFLFTTGEEAGLIGMTSFLDENSFEPDETYFINVDQVGAGKIHFTRAEQLLRSSDSSPFLVRLAGEISGQHPEWEVTSEVYRLLPTDQIAALRQGYQAITIVGLDESAIPPHWHQRSDTVESVDLDIVQIAADLTNELIKRIDAEAVRDIEDTQDLRVPLTEGSVAS